MFVTDNNIHLLLVQILWSVVLLYMYYVYKNTHYSRRFCKCPQTLFYNDKHVVTCSVTQFNLLNHEIRRARICNKKYNVQYTTSLEDSPTDGTDSCTAYS